MNTSEDAMTRAVDELNRRLSRAQRRLVAATTAAAVVAGIVCAAWTLVDFELTPVAVRLVVPALLIGATATLAFGGLVTRGLLALLKGPWAREVARGAGVSAAEVESFALPFGGAPAGKGAERAWRQGALFAAGLVLLGVGLGVLLGRETAVRVVCVVMGCVSTVAFYGYLGFRAPR